MLSQKSGPIVLCLRAHLYVL